MRDDYLLSLPFFPISVLRTIATIPAPDFKMVGISQVTLALGVLALATLSMVAAQVQAQIQQPNDPALQNSPPLRARQLVIPEMAIPSLLPVTNLSYTLHRRAVPDANSGLTRGHRQASLDENGENPVDTMGYDTAAKKEYWEGKYERFNNKEPSSSSPRGTPNDIPSQGTVSDLRNKWENNIPSNANSATDSRRGSDPVNNLGDARDIWEENVPSSQRPGAKPPTPQVPEAGSRHKLDDGSQIPDAELNDLIGEQSASVSDLRNKFENMGSFPDSAPQAQQQKPVQPANPAPDMPAPHSQPPSPNQRADSAPAPAKPIPEALPPQPAQAANPMNPADLPKPGTVQDLKNKYENSGNSDAAPKAPSSPDPAPKSEPPPNPQLPSNPSPPVESLSQPASEPSFADKLRDFSSFHSNRNPISPPVSPKSGSPAPGKRPLHEKINKWEKLSNKDAKRRPEAKYELEDPALHPKPPRPEIPIDAGIDVDAAVQRGMDAIRTRNPEIKSIDKSINDLVKSMQHNAAFRELGDQQIAQIKKMQARRDSEEKEMLKQKADLANKRKRLSEERERLGTDKSEHQQDIAQEAMEDFLDLFRQYNKGIDRMYETIDDIKGLIDATAEMAKVSEANAAAAKELEISIMEDRARRAAEKAKLGKPSKIKPFEIPPIIQSFNVDDGKISNLKTNVPPHNVPLPEPLPGSLIQADDPMRLALDDIRVKGKLTQETADKLVEAGWGLTPEAEQVLKNYNIPVDNMARAKGAIAGFATAAHLAPAGVLASSPEALELAAMAGSPEILGAVGVGTAAPEIAKIVNAALPVVGTGSEQALQQGVVAAQVAGVAGKETFGLITSGTTAVSKSSYAILAAGAGALGAGLGLVGGFIGGLFARKHTKDDAKHAVYNLVTTQMYTKAETKTVMEHITEILVGETITVEKTRAPEPTAKKSDPKSEKSGKSSNIKTKSTSSTDVPFSTVAKSTAGIKPIPIPIPVPIPIPSHKAHVTNSTRSTPRKTFSSKISSSMSSKLDKTRKPVLVPIPVPPYPTNVTNSTKDIARTSSSKFLKASAKIKPVPVPLYPMPKNVTSPAGTISASADPSSNITGFRGPGNVTKSSGRLSASTTRPVAFSPYPMLNVTKSAGNMTVIASKGRLQPPTNLVLYPMVNVTSLSGNMTSVASTATTGRQAQVPPYPMANVTSSTGTMSKSMNPSHASGSWSKSSMTPSVVVTLETTEAANSTRPIVRAPYPTADVTTLALNMSSSTFVHTLASSKMEDITKSIMAPSPTANVTNSAGNMTTTTPTLVLTTPSQVPDINSGTLSWQNITVSPTPTPMSQSQNVTLPSLALPSPTKTQPLTNTTMAMLPTTFETLVRSISSIVPKWTNSSTSSAFPALPTSLKSTPVLAVALETAVPELVQDEEVLVLSHEIKLKPAVNSTMDRTSPFRRRS